MISLTNEDGVSSIIWRVILWRGIRIVLHGLKMSISMNQGFKSDMTKGGEFTVTGGIQEDSAWPLDKDGKEGDSSIEQDTGLDLNGLSQIFVAIAE